MSRFDSAKVFYTQAINNLTPPKEDETQISITSNIISPIESILKGLQKEFNLYSDDNPPLSMPGIGRLLRDKQQLPDESIALLMSTYNQAIRRRFDLTVDTKSENDTLPCDKEIEEMLANVEKIRKLGAARIERIKQIDEAKILWEQANQMLENVDVSGYFEAVDILHAFMKANQLKDEDLRVGLEDKSISPKGYAVLWQISTVTSSYTQAASTFNESSVECSFVSTVGKKSAFFLECKLKPNERANPDMEVQVPKSKVLISIMQHIKKNAERNSKIGACSTVSLMIHKIAALLKLVKHNKVSDDALDQIMSSKGEDLSKYLAYKNATKDKGRKHSCPATTEKFYDLKTKYKDAIGDALKTQILNEFKNKLAEATDKDNLDQIVSELKGTNEYSILKTGQGRITKLLGLKTTSVASFEKMIVEVESTIPPKYN